MWTAFLPLVALLVGEPTAASKPAPVPARVADPSHATPAPFTIGTPREAQLRLSQLLVSADSIESVEATGREITFVLLDCGVGKRVVAHTTKRGVVTSLVVVPFAAHVSGNELGSLSWLGTELADTGSPAITRMTVDEEGAVLITTSDGRRYLLIPGRGSGGSAGRGGDGSPEGNAAVDARWAAAWNDDGTEES